MKKDSRDWREKKNLKNLSKKLINRLCIIVKPINNAEVHFVGNFALNVVMWNFEALN